MTRREITVRPELSDPLYYLRNFHFVLDWVVRRYPDLLAAAEQHFIETLRRLPEPSQALLVRMVMRKGDCFRADRLTYPEIGDTEQAAEPLLRSGLLTLNPAVDISQLSRQLTRPELLALAIRLADTHEDLPRPGASARKRDLVAALAQLYPEPRAWSDWWPQAPTTLYGLAVMDLCERLRLMFFGNLRQEWSTFVLAELGLFRYETVPFDDAARPFARRAEVDAWLCLHQCRERLEQGEPPADILRDIPADLPGSNWLSARRDRVLYRLAYRFERSGDLQTAARLYADIAVPEARPRLIRVLELQGQVKAAVSLLDQVLAAPDNEAEQQQAARMAKRLSRKAGQPPPAQPAAPGWTEQTIQLPLAGNRVEAQVTDHLQTPDAPVYWVENGLINSLLGLLCWPVIFAPLPGAFFHPFQSAPADLTRPEFYRRRQDGFEQALALLTAGDYQARIWHYWHSRQGVQNPFVHWGLMTRPLLELALACLPPTHLELLFRRILFDVKANRSGLPDLVQFYPAAHSYRLLEIKGPGDRLQDNQIRWLQYCARHEVPAEVLYVQSDSETLFD
ncbi:VRR-NUC domain-containing protein [Natronospirillum operosum]|uniref:phosphodiesterase I n=1 Tax=Natronospirillum operosum TaxID=2759953 RepID=A0A4Z0WHW4_9GAMM|nr:VRR-NUC domain-containing protein [Natronospirillum operosum]TGG94200.1 VRR-NUC domain-containing protein [Natronospirillum operosum]